MVDLPAVMIDGKQVTFYCVTGWLRAGVHPSFQRLVDQVRLFYHLGISSGGFSKCPETDSITQIPTFLFRIFAD